MNFRSSKSSQKDITNSLTNCDYFQQMEAICIELDRPSKRPVSTVYRVRVRLEKGEKLYWAKVSQDSEQEYQFLESTYDQFRDVPQLSVVKPAAYLSDISALITEHTDGQPLSYYIKRRLNRISALLGEDASLRRYCYMCGKWLALLHGGRLPAPTAAAKRRKRRPTRPVSRQNLIRRRKSIVFIYLEENR